jgi:hypothetical protein
VTVRAREVVWLAALACMLCACRSRKGACDGERVEALVAQLDAAEPRARPSLLHEQIEQACTLPDWVQRHLDHFAQVPTKVPKLDGRSSANLLDGEAFDRACAASWKELFEVVNDLGAYEKAPYVHEQCELERYGLGTVEDGIPPRVWALHQWLLDQDLTAAQARSISRAVLLSERRATTPVGIFAELTLPEVPRVEELRDVAMFVRVTTEAVVLDGAAPDEQRLVAITDGRILAGEFQDGVVASVLDDLELEVGSLSWSDLDKDQWTLDFAADLDTRVGTILGLARTGARAGFVGFSLVVETAPFEQWALPFELSGPDVKPDLRVDMKARARIGELCGDAARGSIVELTGPESSTADELARTLAAIWQLDCVGRVVLSPA